MKKVTEKENKKNVNNENKGPVLLDFIIELRKYFILIGILFVVIVFLSTSFFEVAEKQKRGLMSVTFLNVGQGDSTLVQTPSNTIVIIDTGPSNNVMKEISDYLHFFNRRIDLVISTHQHTDHIEGMLILLDKYNISYHSSNFRENLSRTAQNVLRKLNENKVNQIMVQAGDRIIVDENFGIYLDVLWPTEKIPITDDNEASVSVILVYGDIGFIITGDAGVKTESYLVDEFGDKLDINVLKLGHHGSRTSTSLKFLEATKPEYAIISASENNRYGHPHQSVLDNLLKYKNKKLEDWVFETKNGSIKFWTNGEQIWLD